MTTLETQSLLLRNFTYDDWQDLQAMIVQYQASECGTYDQQWPTNAEAIQEITQWFASGDSYLAVCLKDTRQFIGFIALNPEDNTECLAFNLGYVFNSDYHGKGYAYEACHAALEYAFGSLQAQLMVTATAAVNYPSRKLLDRLGFQKISEASVSFRTNESGEPIEFLGYSFSLSRDEWERLDQRSKLLFHQS